MTRLQRHFLLFLATFLSFPMGGSAARPMTWLEHREAAKAQLGYQLADPITPVQHLQRALELARSQGASPADIGDLMDRLGQAYAIEDNARGRQEAILLESLSYKERNLGRYAPELVPTLIDLSSVRFYQQRNLESVQLMARALTIRIRNFGAQSAEAAEGYSLLGATLIAVGDNEQAEAMLRKSVNIVRGVPNPPDEVYYAVLSMLSEFLRQRGNIEEAEALHTELVPAMRRVQAQGELEAKNFEHLPRRTPPSDVHVLSEKEVAEWVAKGWATIEPANPPSP